MTTFLKTEDLAGLLSISKKTLERMRCEGNGPAYMKVGRRVIYSQDDITTWLNKNKRKSTSEFLNL